MRYLLLGIVALLFLKAGWGKLEKWITTKSDLSLTFGLDLSQTTPGKAIESWLGQGWANWILWGTVLIMIWLMIQRFLPGGKKASFPTLLGWLIGVMLLAILVVTIKSYLDKEEMYVTVDLRHVKHGEGVTVPMGIGTTAVLRMSTTMVKDGYGNYACPEAKLLRELGTNLTYQVVAGEKTTGVQVALSEESKVRLAKLNISSVDTTFTLTKGPIFGTSPCGNTNVK